MGKIRTKIIGLEEIEKKQKEEAKVRREEKKKREGKIRPVGGKGGERMKQVEISEEALEKMERAKKILEEKPKETKEIKKKEEKKSKKKARGKNYQKGKEKIDRNKKYSLEEAIKILKKIKYARFDESVEVHINVLEKGLRGEVNFPHSIGKETKVAIVDDQLLQKIEKGNLDFDILITHPQYMPRLVKLAKILGPKGLMPNPKTGTISERPEEVAKKFQKGTVRFKTESKFPIIHQVVGKISFEDKKLVENINTLITAVGRSKIDSLYLKSTMSPSIRIQT